MCRPILPGDARQANPTEAVCLLALRDLAPRYRSTSGSPNEAPRERLNSVGWSGITCSTGKPSQNAQDLPDLVQVILGPIDRDNRRFEFEEPPDVARGHSPRDALLLVPFALIVHTSRYHCRDTLTQSTRNVLLLGFDDGDDWRTDVEALCRTGEQVVAGTIQPLVLVDIERNAGEQTHRLLCQMDGFHQNRGDNHLGAGLLRVHGEGGRGPLIEDVTEAARNLQGW